MTVTPAVLPVKVIIEHKRYLVYPSHISYRVLVKVGKEIEAFLEVPPDFVYLIPGEIHDVPVDYFTHTCIKDDMTVLPETLIDGTSMILNYPEPILVERYWLGKVKNVSNIYSPPGADAIFRLRVPVLVIPKSTLKMWREEIGIEREMREVLAQAWAKATPEEKIRLMTRVPEMAVLVK